MKLTQIRIERFKNVVDAQTIKIEPDVTCFIGKNEAGKTTILKALHRLNPANGSDRKFDVTVEYPRWRLSRDRREGDLDAVRPITAWFMIEPEELSGFDEIPARVPEGTECRVSKTYGNLISVSLSCPFENVIRQAATDASVAEEDQQDLLMQTDAAAVRAKVTTMTKELKALQETARAKSLVAFSSALDGYSVLFETGLTSETQGAIFARIPKFFYFSTYEMLPGEINLNNLAAKVKSDTDLTPAEQTVVSLLKKAGEGPSDFLDSNYDSRKAELQAASADLTHHVFEYWKQNTDLAVVFDTDMVPVGNAPDIVHHRILKIEIRDGRHGDVETNFATRSSGFQWFFSFFAAFSEYQESDESIIVLLDEPGTSLHGEAQKDFLRFVFDELGASKQTMYTTHSQYMVDPSRYEKMRGVHDQATRENQNLGVQITDVSLSADRDTVLPVESALGYSISQHLFIGSGHHLAVEGSSDFVYLQRGTEYLVSIGSLGLDPKLAIIPVGGDSNMPAFVALLGRRLKVSALIDGDRSAAKLQRVKAAAKANSVPESSVVACSDVGLGVPSTADIEDLFDPADYLRLYNWAFHQNVAVSELPCSNEPIIRKLEQLHGSFDHALPAHALTDHRDEFWSAIQPTTVERFTALFALLNATLYE